MDGITSASTTQDAYAKINTQIKPLGIDNHMVY